jgi:hypothetical protein
LLISPHCPKVQTYAQGLGYDHVPWMTCIGLYPAPIHPRVPFMSWTFLPTWNESNPSELVYSQQFSNINWGSRPKMWQGPTLCHSVTQYQSQVYTTLDTLLGSLKPYNLSSCNVTVFPNNLAFSWDSSNSNHSLNFSASCVRPPHAFLIGNLNFSVTANQMLGHIQYKNCTLHTCFDSSVTSPF